MSPAKALWVPTMTSDNLKEKLRAMTITLLDVFPGEGFDADLESAWISVSLIHKPWLMVKKNNGKEGTK